jgi:gentisate 1,2-dioxygenase
MNSRRVMSPPTGQDRGSLCLSQVRGMKTIASAIATSFSSCSRGTAWIYTDHGDKPPSEGDVVYSPRGCWHGFNNTSTEDVVLV